MVEYFRAISLTEIAGLVWVNNHDQDGRITNHQSPMRLVGFIVYQIAREKREMEVQET
jgi:hypothetical protein